MMEFWMVARVWASKAWAFIKKYWQIFAGLVYALVVWLVFRGEARRVREVLEVANKTHAEELEILNATHAKEIQLREEAVAQYEEIIAQIEKDYENRKEELSDKKREEVKQLVAENSEDPSNLSKLLAERFGISHIGEE
jgi:F0F1-type ATP synthase membrane subunit b/b'